MEPSSVPGRMGLLATVPLFRHCRSRDLEVINALVHDLDVAAGAVIVREGDVGDHSYIVVSGEATVMVKSTPVGTLGPGDVFGELALLAADATRGATVTASTPMRLLVLGRAGYDAVSNLPCLGDQAASA
jgi:CRP-like cAMP-binding protein